MSNTGSTQSTLWPRIQLGELCKFLNGGTPSKGVAHYFEGDIPWITGADITSNTVTTARSLITKQAIAGSATNCVPAGTVLLVTRTSVGKVAIAGVDLCFSQDITALRPDKSKLDSQYLMGFLQAQQRYLASQARGATIKGITRDVVSELEILLPPLKEQRRIAAILNKAEDLRAKRREAIAKLDSLAQAIFLDMFGDPIENDRNWPIGTVSDFVGHFESGKSIVANDQNDIDSKYRVLKISSVTSLEFRPEQSKALPPDYLPPKSHFVKNGDLLFSRANTSELIGATAHVNGTPTNLLLPDKIWRFVWHREPKADLQFVRFLFRQPKFREELSSRATGTSGSMKNITQDKVMSIKVGLPPLELQKMFGKRIGKLESLKIHSRDSNHSIETLFSTLQHRAFHGEL